MKLPSLEPESSAVCQFRHIRILAFSGENVSDFSISQAACQQLFLFFSAPVFGICVFCTQSADKHRMCYNFIISGCPAGASRYGISGYLCGARRLGCAQLSPVACRHGVWQASETGHPFPGIKKGLLCQAAGRRKERVEPYGFHRAQARRGRPCWPDCSLINCLFGFRLQKGSGWVWCAFC